MQNCREVLQQALGLRSRNLPISLASIMQAVIDERDFKAQYGILQHEEGVHFLPANIELSGTELILMNTMSRENVLRHDLDTVKKDYDYILIDCMTFMGLMTINMLAAADSVIISSQPSYLSTKGLNLLMRSIARAKKKINLRLRIDGILLTMVDNRTNHAKAITASLRASVGENICVLMMKKTPINHYGRTNRVV